MFYASRGSSQPFELIEGDGSVPPNPALLTHAAQHGLDLLLFDRVLQEGGLLASDFLRREAALSLKAAATENVALMEELVRVLDGLRESSIPALPLKGPSLAWQLWKSLSVRRCRDLDILVPSRLAARSLEVLDSLGYQRLPPFGGLRREVHLAHVDSGRVLDLHWNIVFEDIPLQMDYDEIWRARTRLPWNGRRIPIPSPEWLFFILSIYLIRGYPWPELRYLSDLARLVDRFPDLDWEKTATIAAKTGTRRICGVCVALLGALPKGRPPSAARTAFPVDGHVIACAQRFAAALSGSSPCEAASPARRLVRAVAHLPFRDRPQDKARILLGMVPLALRPSRQEEGERWSAAALNSSVRLLKVVAPPLRRAIARVTRGDRVVPGVMFRFVGDWGLLWSPMRRKLYGLSPSAAFLWCCLEEGASPRCAVRLLTAASKRPRADVNREVQAALRHWREVGLVGADGPPASEQGSVALATPPARSRGGLVAVAAPVRRRYRVLREVFEIGFSDMGMYMRVDEALRHLRTSAAATAAVSVTGAPGSFAVLIDGLEAARCQEPEAVCPMVLSAVGTEAVNRHEFQLCVHAALLARGAEGVLLPGASGSGKTCLAATLAKTEFNFHADDVSLLGRGYSASGIRMPFAAKAGAWTLLRGLYPELERAATHRRVDGKRVKYLSPPPLANGSAQQADPVAVRLIIFPRFTATGPNEVSKLSEVEGLQRLMDSCHAVRMSMDADDIDSLVDWISHVAWYSVAYNDLKFAASSILSLR